MRYPLLQCLLLCLVLAACEPLTTPAVALATVDVASVAVFGRGTFDLAYSYAKHRDCSIVRLDKGESYCRPIEPPPAAPEFCTRTLGAAECFADPAFLADHPSPTADGPARLSAVQEKNRTAQWPSFE